MNRRASVLGLVILIGSAVAIPSAHALTSAGLSANCDSDGHCVTGSAMSSNAGSNVETIDISVVATEAGAAVAICKGTAPGATLIQITCSIGQKSETMSFPGSAGAVPVATTTGTLARMPVCWDVLGFFPVILGAEHQVPTGGCAIVGV